jgi:hypothetical protein
MQDRIDEAAEIFGDKIVQEVLTIVNTSDPDGAYTMFEDEGYFEHAECVEFIYFE